MTEQGPEPTGWELMRVLGTLREDIKEVGSRVVSTDVYLADQRGTTERFIRLEARLRDTDDEKAKAETQAKADKADAERWRRQSRLSMALAAVAGLISVAGIIAGLLR